MENYMYLPYEYLSQNVKKVLQKNTSYDFKERLALGDISLSPLEIVELVYFLMFDDDKRISQTAYNTLKEFPEELLEDILPIPFIHPQILDFFGCQRFKNIRLFDKIVDNPRSYDTTVQFIAENRADFPLLNKITDKLERLSRFPSIIRVIREHPLTNESIKSKFSFIQFPYSMLPSSIKEKFKPDSSKHIKMAAARGTFPLIPSDISVLLFYLMFDQDKDISMKAEETLCSLPFSLLDTISKSNQTSIVIDYLVRKFIDKLKRRYFTEKEKIELEKFFENVILNQSTNDYTISFITSEIESLKILEIVANNQVRLLKAPYIYKSLLINRITPISTLDRIRYFSPVFSEIYEEFSKEFSKYIKIGESSLKKEDITEEYKEGDESFIKGSEEEEDQKGEEEELDSDFIEEKSFTNEERIALAARILKMNMLQKKRIAWKGNREARTIIMRTRNKVLQECVLQNPKLTIEELIKYTNDRALPEELIRMIIANKEWMKHYKLQLALVMNPKTPIHIALKYVNILKEKDLYTVSQCKDVSGLVSGAAKRLYKLKSRLL